MLSKVKGIPRQLNGSDCGVFTCQYAEVLSRSFQKKHQKTTSTIILTPDYLETRLSWHQIILTPNYLKTRSSWNQIILTPNYLDTILQFNFVQGCSLWVQPGRHAATEEENGGRNCGKCFRWIVTNLGKLFAQQIYLTVEIVDIWRLWSITRCTDWTIEYAFWDSLLSRVWSIFVLVVLIWVQK